MSAEAASAAASEHGDVPHPFTPAAPAVADTLATAESDAVHTLGGGGDEVEPDHPSVLGHLIRQLSPFQDLTRVLIPSFFLEPRSLLEKMSDVMMHPQLVLEYVYLAFPHQWPLRVPCVTVFSGRERVVQGPQTKRRPRSHHRHHKVVRQRVAF